VKNRLADSHARYKVTRAGVRRARLSETDVLGTDVLGTVPDMAVGDGCGRDVTLL